MDGKGLYEDGIEQASKAYAIGENFLFLVTIGVGAAGMYPLLNFAGIPLLSIAYVVFLSVMLGFTLRKHLCTHCYYYDKWCHCGWGRLASKLGYAPGSGNRDLGGKLGGATWGTLMLLPILAMIVGFVLNGAPLSSIVLFASFFALVVVNMVMHIKDCKSCKARFVCPVSAAKKA